MNRVAIDTSAYSAFKRGHPEVTLRLRRAREIVLPAVVLGELLAGFEVGSRTGKNREELRLFLESPRVRLARIGEETAERYARIDRALRSAGRPLPTNDLWIAASVMEHGAELLTLDRDFPPSLRSWSASSSREPRSPAPTDRRCSGSRGPRLLLRDPDRSDSGKRASACPDPQNALRILERALPPAPAWGAGGLFDPGGGLP